MCTVPFTIVMEEEAEELDSAGDGEWERELEDSALYAFANHTK